MPYTFNGAAKTITINGTGAVTVTANDIYSRWVDWVQSGAGPGFDEAVRAIGGEDIGGGLTAGVYVFLALGWSLVVPTAITTLTVQGNVTRAPEDSSGAPLYINQGAALIVREVSAVALGYSTGDGGFLSSDRANLTTTKNLLEADERIRADRYQKLQAGTATVILDKDVTVNGDNIDLVEHV